MLIRIYNFISVDIINENGRNSLYSYNSLIIPSDKIGFYFSKTFLIPEPLNEKFIIISPHRVSLIKNKGCSLLNKKKLLF